MEIKNQNLMTEAIQVLPLRERASFFTRADNDLFQYLITKYKDVLFDNKTDNYTKRNKQRVWQAILDEFNMAAEEPRTLRKLKFKFHNTKTKARKTANDDKLGKKPFITNSNDIKWMQSIMAISMIDQNHEPDAEDFCINNHQEEDNQKAHIEIVQYNPVKTKNCVVNVPEINDNKASGKRIEMEVQVDVKETIVPERDPLCTPKSSFGDVSCVKTVPKKSAASKTPVTLAAKSELPNTVQSKSFGNYDKRLYKLRARHMQEQRNEEHELFQLKKRKLLIEINMLVK